MSHNIILYIVVN